VLGNRGTLLLGALLLAIRAHSHVGCDSHWMAPAYTGVHNRIGCGIRRDSGQQVYGCSVRPLSPNCGADETSTARVQFRHGT
jgi:hypothetical protein